MFLTCKNGRLLPAKSVEIERVGEVRKEAGMSCVCRAVARSAADDGRVSTGGWWLVASGWCSR